MQSTERRQLANGHAVLKPDVGAHTKECLMTNRPQQQTLSVRISDTLRLRLERARHLMASRTGTRVSTSAIAKQLLESAREDRLEVVDLLAHPTDTLLQIRRKGTAQHPLSRAEWMVLAHFLQRGLEACSARTPTPPCRDSFVAVLDAFLAVYELRTTRASPRDALYVGHLPSECRPSTGTRAGRREPAPPEIVRRTVAETRRRLSGPTEHASCAPLLAGRSLSVLLEEEPLTGLDAVNRALRPYWPALWRLAARGHYVVTHQPVREPSTHRHAAFHPAMPSITEGNYTLSFAREEDREFAFLLSFPGTRATLYPIRRYPAITEFRAMLTALAPDGTSRCWSGGYFLGYVAEAEHEEPVFWFRAHDNGITLGFSAEEWDAVRALVRRAWDIPDIRAAWDTLSLEYGEL